MKKLQFLLFVSVLLSLVLSACGATAATPLAATPAAVGGKVDAMPVAYIGVVESINGDQWVINGRTVTVAASVVRDGPFQPGDSVKVEGVVNQDGSFTVSRVEVPGATDVSGLPQFGDDNSNDSNTNDGNINEGNVNADNGNDASVNDDNSNDASGVNSNDDDSNSSPSSDDNGNGSNSNDDDSNGNDDNSGDDNNSGSGGDDNGGNSNDD